MNLKGIRVACFPSAVFSCMGNYWSRQDLIMVVFRPSNFSAARTGKRVEGLCKGVILIIDHTECIKFSLEHVGTGMPIGHLGGSFQ